MGGLAVLAAGALLLAERRRPGRRHGRPDGPGGHSKQTGSGATATGTTPARMTPARTTLARTTANAPVASASAAMIRPPEGRTTAAAVLVATVAGLSAGVFVAGVGGQDLRSGVLAQLAARAATVDAELVVTDDPRPIAGRPGSPAGRVAVPARLVRVSAARGATGSGAAGGVAARLDVPVLVLAGGDGWPRLLPSTRVAVTARLVAPRPGDQIGALLLVRGPPRLTRGPVWYQRVAGVLRADLRAAATVLPQPVQGLLPALIDGDVSGLDPQLRDDFRAAGLTHLTAVSGGNVAILTGAVLAALRRTRVGLRSRALWAAGTIIAFAVVARPSASVLRAGAMGLLGALATGTGRGSAVLPALSATVSALVLAQPELALSAGFALSVLATAGIVVLAPGWRDRLARRLPERLGWLADGAAVAAAAQVACLPVVAWIGGGVSLVAIPANIAAAVVVAPVTVLGVIALAAGPVSGEVARLAAWLAGWPCRWLVLVARTAAGVPGGHLRWPGGPLGALAALAALPAGYAVARRPRGRRVCAAALTGLLVARCALVGRLAPWPPPGWVLVACDVGQGDALVLAAGPSAGVLVDAGPDPAALAACLRQLGIRQLPVVLLTHLHADHVDGLSGVLGDLPVGEILVGALHEPADRWAALQAEAAEADVPVTRTAAGDGRVVGPVDLAIVGPVRPLAGTDSDPNNNSLLTIARTGGLTILLTGDAEDIEQRQLLRAGVLAPYPVDVLKVAHHGSASQEPGMLGESGAQVALISVGAGNSYGHPAPATLAALDAAGIPYARTDLDGAAAVVPTAEGAPALVARRSR
ncbi:ComEC/Rec2 family competence protein [Frankia sp. CN7]|uniref:ComEC/Rec2 family competence protein n=2 Tax=Frankia nepalensis TaxID=1836974 RepID=A0A937UTT1_9ACTN|nr:ComEC/Rec2 family competence protein [Frankia nepalensis]MBL7511163.1 ComEC/Rec2 family competence protein [Frankia nepalensis]MBL7631575.1 ComEC/Rec2 family competence protein [Frankia nepalensis]